MVLLCLWYYCGVVVLLWYCGAVVLQSPECDDGERSVRLVRPPLPDICPPEVVDPDLCPGAGSRHVLVVDDGRDICRTL